MAKSVAVITIISEKKQLMVRSTGCGIAGKYADHVVELLRAIDKDRDQIMSGQNPQPSTPQNADGGE